MSLYGLLRGVIPGSLLLAAAVLPVQAQDILRLQLGIDMYYPRKERLHRERLLKK